MNNATLALNVSRPAAPPSPSPAGRDADASSTPKRFDAVLDAAHGKGHDPRDPTQTGRDSHASPADNDSSAAASVTAPKSDGTSDDEPAKKDDAHDDTSMATTMLSLIGVPPNVADVAGKALDVAKGVAGDLPGLPAALAGILPGAAGVGASVAGVAVDVAGGVPGTVGELAALNNANSLTLGTTAQTAATVPAIAPSFGSLLAQGGGLVLAKDDTSATDPANASPMPFAHLQGLAPSAGPVVQVQATQVATSPQFAQELGEQIAWMGSGDVKEARIKLHPEELGSMDVRVNLDGGKVNVAIMAQHPAAVHAVQQTLSQLDRMLAHHGLSLGQADVGQRQAEQGGRGDGAAADRQGSEADTNAATGTVVTSSVSRGLVDEVA